MSIERPLKTPKDVFLRGFCFSASSFFFPFRLESFPSCWRKYSAGGGGAGGAGQSGSSALDVGKGGKGLASEITGESLYYGAGGGGGLSFFDTYSGGGLGGSNSRGGDGARVEFVDNGDGTITTNILKATAGAVNSGSGGGGGSNVSGCTAGARGADGVVIFRYDFNATPPGLIFMVR